MFATARQCVCERERERERGMDREHTGAGHTVEGPGFHSPAGAHAPGGISRAPPPPAPPSLSLASASPPIRLSHPHLNRHSGDPRAAASILPRPSGQVKSPNLAPPPPPPAATLPQRMRLRHQVAPASRPLLAVPSAGLPSSPPTLQPGGSLHPSPPTCSKPQPPPCLLPALEGLARWSYNPRFGGLPPNLRPGGGRSL